MTEGTDTAPPSKTPSPDPRDILSAAIPGGDFLKILSHSYTLDQGVLKPLTGEETGLPDSVLAPALAAGGYGAIKAQEVISGIHGKLSTGTLPLADRRTLLATAAVLRGQAPVEDLLKASYGEWPPKGLDITVPQNPHPVRLGSITEIVPDMPGSGTFSGRFKNELYALGNVEGTANNLGSRTVILNPLRLGLMPALVGKSGLADAMGHEAAHILQRDFYERLPASRNVPGLFSEIWNRDVMEYPSDVAFKAFFQNTDRNVTMQWDDRTRSNFNYMCDSKEIQARIHQFTAHGYQTWKRVPTNTEQFLVAMQSSGLYIPKEIMDTLESSPTIAETRRLFPPVSPHPEAKNINIIQSALKPEGLKIFWEETMPTLYGHLIENYGDGPGRARMGLGENRLPSIIERIGPLPPGPPDVVKGKYTGSIIGNAVVGTAVAAGTLALGGKLEDSVRNGAAAIIPFYEAGNLALEGDTKGAKQSAATEAFALAAGTGIALTGAPIAATVAVTLVAKEAATVAYQTPERLETSARYAERKEAIVHGFSDYTRDMVSGHIGKPADDRDMVRALEDPDIRKNIEKALRDEGREQDLKTFGDFCRTDEEYAAVMEQKFGMHDSIETREAAKRVNDIHQNLGF